jgi:hypothetical protein
MEDPVKKLLTFASSSLAVAAALLATAGAPSAATSAKAFDVGATGLPQIIVPGDRIELLYHVWCHGSGYCPQTIIGSAYVRNDLQGRFVRLPLTGKKGSQWASTILPAHFIRGHRLVAYAVVTDVKTKRSVTTPKQSAPILHKPVVVKLGKHKFGQTRSPEAVVARASAADVGWDIGEAFALGPQTLNVAADGSVWLQDSYNARLLAWNPGQPDHFARAVPLPGFAGGGDFVFGRDGTIYASAPGDGHYAAAIFHLSATGKVLAAISVPHELSFPLPVGQLALRVGPDGTIYCAVGGEQADGLGGFSRGFGWMPVATPAGKPLAVPQQRRGILWGYEPLARGRRLISGVYTPPRSETGPKDVRYAVVGRGGRILRSWRILSRTVITPGDAPFFTPELVGGDPVVAFEVAHPAQVEHVVLRLGPHRAKARFSLPKAIFGMGTYYADLRIGPDGDLYRLSTSDTAGIEIDRYSLG